ncbi:CocE/NonD family hydrolase [Nocardioides mesophilus]|uniref:CocE/NonD family hydrolase n=1 Tax=Nocardioides mesophilus TaxID=433659 RepID=A0A7G9R7D5_9ACTN|nr:CocE/NonD family hydrolase [Nocardioides mesophilus]QNN51510.1 CocE/NonD family hydrolase [Nocardioides mesophilus]
MGRARRAGLAAAAGILGSAGLGVTGPGPQAAAAADDTPGYSLRHIFVDTLVGPAGDQPCRISADLYTPDGAGRRHRKPAILTTHGFGGDKADGNQTATARGFVREGYVVLSYSGLGFGGSECKIRLDDPAWDGKAGKQLVDVLAGERPYVDEATGTRGRVRTVARERAGDPRVGMIGGSYGGQVQYAVAMQDKRIDALIPIITWNDLAYSLAPNNTDFTGDRAGVSSATPGVAKKEWVDLFFGAGILDGIDDAQVDPARNVGCPNFADDVCPAAVVLNTAGYPDQTVQDIARRASVAHYLRRISAPTLLVQGQKDTLFNLQEAAATYRGLRRQGTEVAMVWQSWGHSGSTPAPGELDLSAGSLRDSYLGRRFLAWMDRNVRGDRSVPAGPAFSYFRDWVRYNTSPRAAGRAVAKAYAERSSFSAGQTGTLYLSGSDRLVRRSGAVRSGAASYANAGPAPTSYSETSGLEGNQVNQPVSDAPGTFVAFTSRPLARGVAVVGSPRLTLHLDAPVAAQSQAAGPAGQLVLFVKLYDVAPDGTPTLKNRLISPVRVGDVTAPVRVTLPAIVHRLRAGHRLQVVVAASDAAYAGNATAQPVTVTTSPAAPSVLRLPLTGELRF